MQSPGLGTCGFGSGWYPCGLFVKGKLLPEWNLAWKKTLFLSEKDVSLFGVGMTEIVVPGESTWIPQGFGTPVAI